MARVVAIGIITRSNQRITTVPSREGCATSEGAGHVDSGLPGLPRPGRSHRVSGTPQSASSQGGRVDAEEEYRELSTHWKKAMYTPKVIAAAASGKPGAGTPAPPSPPTNPPPSPPPNNPPPTPPSGPEQVNQCRCSRLLAAPRRSTGNSILKKKGVNTPLPPQGPGVIVPPPPPTPSSAGAAVTPPAVSTGAMSPLALTMPTPLTSVGAAAVLYDRIAQLLEKLLRSNTVTKTPITPLASPPRFPARTHNYCGSNQRRSRLPSRRSIFVRRRRRHRRQSRRNGKGTRCGPPSWTRCDGVDPNRPESSVDRW